MDNFEEIYNKLLNENYYILEKLRKKEKKLIFNSIIYFFIASCILVSGYVNIFSINTNFYLIAFVICITLFLTSFITLIKRSMSKETDYFKNYKELIISPLIEYVFPSSNYISDKYIDESIYSKCSFQESYALYTGDDFVNTKVALRKDEFSLMFSEITTKKESRDSDDKKYYSILFQGIAGYIDYPCNIDHNIEIKRNSFFKSNDRIEMDSSEFEKYFDVQCDNRMLALQLLTSDVMNQFIDFLKDNKLFFEVNIVKNDKIYFRFFTYPFSTTMFETSLFRNSLDKYTLKTYFNILTCIKTFANIISTSIEDI